MLKTNKRIRRFDPTRTTLLRRAFLREMRKRFLGVSKQIRKFLVEDDELGLVERKSPLILMQQQYAFATDPQKLKAFQTWLKQQVDAGILIVSGRGILGKPWTYEYVEAAYKKGVNRAYMDVNKPALAKSPVWYAGSRAQFIKTALALPQFVSKLELLSLRTYEQLNGITAGMSQQMARIMSTGLASGHSPIKIAREMHQTIAGLSRYRAGMIAQTEIINAHAEGQLDSFQLLGVDKLGILAEFSTAGDDLVCAKCADLEGKEFTVDEARGVIPVHPSCRCCWIPSGQK